MHPQQTVPGDQQAYHSYQGGFPMGGLNGPGGDVADECAAPSTVLDWSAPQCASQLSPSDRAAVDVYVRRYACPSKPLYLQTQVLTCRPLLGGGLCYRLS